MSETINCRLTQDSTNIKIMIIKDRKIAELILDHNERENEQYT